MLDGCGVERAGFLDEGLEAERVGVSSGGKEAVRELEEREELVSARGDGRVLWG